MKMNLWRFSLGMGGEGVVRRRIRVEVLRRPERRSVNWQVGERRWALSFDLRDIFLLGLRVLIWF